MTDVKSAPPEAKKPSPDDTGTLRTIIYAILIALVIRTFAFEPFNIPSSSMVPTLLIGDFLFVSKYTYGYTSHGTFYGLPHFSGRLLGREPERGDVVVFKWPRDNSTDYIKRLIGLPGDHIQMKEGILYINGAAVPRARLAEPVPTPGEDEPSTVTDYMENLPGGVDHVIRKRGENEPLDNTQEFVVPPHHYFMMGDNRDNSQDSRTSNVGYVPEENLVGKARVIFFSLGEGTHFWEFWTWPWTVRWGRLFTVIG